MLSNETKREAFERLANQRTNAVLQKLRVLGHCSNGQLYEYTEEDIKAIFRAIRAELRAVESKFGNGNHSAEFRLGNRRTK